MDADVASENGVILYLKGIMNISRENTKYKEM